MATYRIDRKVLLPPRGGDQRFRLEAPVRGEDGQFTFDCVRVEPEQCDELKKLATRLYAATRAANQFIGDARRFTCISSDGTVAVYRVDQVQEAPA